VLPWFDRTGRFSPLRFVVFWCVATPALWIAFEAWQGWLGSRPVNEAIHQTGAWAVRLLAVTLAVTPLKLALRWPKLIAVRRMLGLSVLAYALLHFGLYIFDQHFDLPHVAAEIVLRIYLAIGFVALAGLCVLGATSTDAMIRKLGANWTRLHRIVYAIAALGTVHFFMQSKLDVTQPIIMAGIFGLLMLYRVAQRVGGDLAAPSWALLAVAAASVTALGEALWFNFSVGAPLDVVLGANLDFSFTIRPAWYVLGVGALLVFARISRPFIAGARGRPQPQRVRAATVG
jgi:sulfoxide reductase heme-binding subunit YedZ